MIGRERIRGVVDGLGLMPTVRSVQKVVGPRVTRRDLKDTDQLRLVLAIALAPDSNCIDVGANVGSVLTEMVRLAPEGRHVAFEPIPELAADLARRFPRVDVHEAGLSSEAGTTEFCHVPDKNGLSGFRKRGDVGSDELQMLTVKVEALDSALPEGYVPALIKIDVEGAEKGVIEGGIETIERHRPVVVFEHGAEAAPLYDTGPSDIYALLVQRAGLRIFDFDGNGPYDEATFQATFDAGTYWNFVACP